MEYKRSIKALEQFMQNANFRESISVEQSIKNLEEGLVELFYETGQHKGNGLLITEDGYFLTVSHLEEENVEKSPPAKYIRDYHGRIYKIDKICQINKREDLALLKAEISKKDGPKKYRIYQTDQLKNLISKEFPINLKIVKDGRIKNKYGYIFTKFGMDEKLSYTNQFGTDISVVRGESGGIAISVKGELIGFISNGFQKEGQGDKYLNFKIKSYHSKVLSGLELVKKEINNLKILSNNHKNYQGFSLQ